MASGYTQRFKGKITARRIDMAAGGEGITVVSTYSGSTITISASEISGLDLTITTASTIVAGAILPGAATPISANGITVIGDSSASSTWYLADPYPGAVKTLIKTSTTTSTGVQTVATLTTGVVIYGGGVGVSADRMTFPSTKTLVGDLIRLLGISTSAWAVIGGAYNASSVAGTTASITLSTRA